MEDLKMKITVYTMALGMVAYFGTPVVIIVNELFHTVINVFPTF